ncbi:hypothetical protein BSNK01_10830 [Bacillaceae bacterium]
MSMLFTRDIPFLLRTRWIGKVLLWTLVLAFLLPETTGAYTYGNPNEEKIAEVYKQVVAALNQSPKDYGTVEEVVAAVKEEMTKEFGEEAVSELERYIQAKEDERIVKQFQVILVRNVERRFYNLEKVFEDYAQAKVLLAKAFATYEALSPSVQAKDPALDQALRGSFDSALKALGNPGLFGVGKEEPDRERFQQEKEKILTSLKDFFQTDVKYEGHAIGEAANDAAGAAEGEKDNGWLLTAGIIAVVVAVVAFLTWLGKKKR